MKRALAMVAHDPDLRPAVPFRYALDQLERRYGQPPGSARTWDAEDLLRALDYQRLESEMRTPSHG